MRISDWSSDVCSSDLRQHVLDHEGSVRDPKAYVFAIIDAWRLAIKHRDVFAKPGIRYGDPRRGMLEGESWHNSRLMVARALGRSLEADPEIDGLDRKSTRLNSSH